MKLRRLIPIHLLALAALLLSSSIVNARAAEGAAPQAVVSSASFQPTVAPDSLATVFGTNLAAELIVAEPDADGVLPTSLGGVSVEIDGRLASLLFVSPTQINFLVPAETSLGPVTLTVLSEGTVGLELDPLVVPVEHVAPAIFKVGCLHPDRAAALNAVTFESGPIVSPPSGDADGESTYISVFGTGFRAAADISVELKDRTGRVTVVAAMYGGPASGYDGLDQINFQVPLEMEGAGVLELRLRVDGRLSNAVSIHLTNIVSAALNSGNYLISTYAGVGSAGYSGDGSAALQAELRAPHDVEIGPDGSLYIADMANHVVRRVSVSGAISTFAGTGEEGSDGDGGLAVEARLHTPVAVAVDARGNVYIADAGAHKVRKVSTAGIITTFAGTGTQGMDGEAGAATAAQLSSPFGLAINQYGSLLIADKGSHRILLVGADGNLHRLAGIGTPGDSGDGGSARLAEIREPTSIAVTELGVVLFADSGNRKIRRIEATGVIHTVAATGAMPGKEEMDSSLYVSLSLDEQLVISDEGDHRMWAFGLDCLLERLAGQDHPGPLGEGTPAIEAELNLPGGTATNIFGDVFVADSGNHRARVLWRLLGDEDAACGEVAAMAFGPSVVIGGERVRGFVRINCATDVDVDVLLSSDTPNAPAPAQITIPAGSLIGTFTIDTPVVEEIAMVHVTATAGGAPVVAVCTLLPGDGPGLNGLEISVDSVVGGESTVGHVTLGAPAPVGGMRVDLSVNHSVVDTVASVTVPEGSISAEFVIETQQVTSSVQAVITGETGELTATDTLVVLPSGAGALSLVSYVVDVNSLLGGGTLTATVTAEGPAPEGGLEVLLSANTPSVTTPTSVIIPEGEVSVQFEVRTLEVQTLVVAFLKASANNTVQATVSIQPPAQPQQGALLGLTLAPNPVTGGASATGTVELAAPAPAGGVEVTLGSDNPVATVPPALVIPEGQTTGQFQVSTTAPASQQVAQITATSANTVSAALTIDAGAVCVGSLVLSVEITDVLSGNGILHATATLDGPAPQGGAQVQLVRGAVSLGTIDIPQGQTSGAVDLTIANLLSIVGSTVQAVLGGCPGVQATITLGSPVTGTIVGVTLNPTSVPGGSPSTGTVTLAHPAPASGIVVDLSSDNPNATVPAIVAVASGQTTAQFTVNTTAVGSEQVAQITATSANSVSAALTLQAASAGQGQIASIALNPTSVPGGSPSTGTVTLATTAPAGGILVELASGNANATVPGSIIIPEGQTTGQFAVTTVTVDAQQTAQITATSANSVSADLTLEAAAAGSGQIGSLALNPASVIGGGSSTGTVTLTATAPAGGVLVELSSGNANATVSASITIPEGQVSGQFTVTTATVASEQTAQITATSANAVSKTLTITPETACVGSLVLDVDITDVLSGNGILHATVTLDGPAPQGGSQIQLLRAGASIGTVNVPQGQTSGTVDLTINNLLTIVGSTVEALLGNCPGVQATITLGTPVTADISGVSLNPTSVLGGSPSTGTVTLAAAAPASGILVNLSSDSGSATVPPSIAVPAGQTTAQFTVNTTAVGAQTTAQITATSANSANANLIINPDSVCVGSLVLDVDIADVLSGDGILHATVTLDGPAPQGGSQIQLLRAGASIGTVNVPQGQTSGTVDLTINNLLTIVGSTVEALLGNCPGVQATITLGTPVTGTIVGVSLNPTSVLGGSPSTGTVTLAAAAPASGILVNLSSDSGSATVPASIAVPAGQTTAQFTVNTTAVGAQTTVEITATSANSAGATLTIEAATAGEGQIASLALDPTSVVGGGSSTGTVTLAASAPLGGILVNLSSGNANATTPASITIPQGQASGQFTVNTTAVGAQQTAQITATSANAVSQNLTIQAGGVCVNSLVLDVELTDLLSGDGILHATASLDGPAPAGGSQIELVRSGVTLGYINVPEGQTSGSVDLTIANLLSVVGSTVEAVLNGCPAVVATITLGQPITGAIGSVTLNPSTVFAGAAVTGTVTLVSPAGSNGVLVNLSTDNPSATLLSSSVVVPSGQVSTTFPINTVNTSASPVSVTITGTSGASSKSASLTINSSNPCVEGLNLTVNITNLVSGEGVLNAFVTLTGPAPAGGANVPLLIGDSQIGQVAIPANQSTGTVGVTLANLPTLLGSTVRAVLGPCGVNATISLSAPLLGSLTVPVSLTLGQNATGTITLTEPAPQGGATITLTENPLGVVGDLLNALLGAVVVPDTVVVAEGQTTANFSISSSVVGGVLGALLPSSTNLQVDAALQSAFSASTDSGIIQILK